MSFSVVVTLMLLVLAEVVVRVADLGPSRFAQPRHLETEDKRRGLDLYPDDPRDAFDLDLRDSSARQEYASLGLHVDDYFQTTPHGVDLRYSAELCRGGDIGAKTDGVPRIVVVGDSFAEGQGVREEETSSAHLQRLLGDGYEVINCGRRGFDVSDVREFLARRSSLEPDVLIYAYTLNDPEQSEAFAAQQTYLDDWILDRRRMVSEGHGGLSPFESHLWAAVVDRSETASVGRATTQWYQQMVEEPNAEGWQESIEHVLAMKDATAERGARFIVVVQPLLVELDGDYPFEIVHTRVVSDLSERGVEVRDALPAFRGMDAPTLWVHPSDRHPNGAAHRIIAEVFEQAIGGAE